MSGVSGGVIRWLGFSFRVWALSFLADVKVGSNNDVPSTVLAESDGSDSWQVGHTS